MTPDAEGPTSPIRRLRGFVVLGAGILLSLSTMVLARFPGAVERIYASGVGPPIARGLSLLTGWVPFSVAVALVVLLVVWTGLRAAAGVKVMRDAGARRKREIVVAGMNRLAGVTGSLLLLFYPLWGFNYARAPLDVRLGMATEGRIDAAELVELTGIAAKRTNDAYQALHGVPD
ncbi:MAG: DUF3810 family protein, partial [Longimicrobiales bacterium]|nr:DUF3810 family protein [Longimicrobiales bacterium]